MKIKSIKTIEVSRKDMFPDVDIDISSEGRDHVKHYIEQKYDNRHVCSIGTYTRLKLKGALKDLSRIHSDGLKFNYINYITKFIDNQIDYTWDDLFKYAVQNEDLKKFIQKYPEIVNNLKFILNQPKATSVHASAVLILPKEDSEGNKMDIFDWLPVRKVVDKTGQEVLVSEWEGEFTDQAGFLKEDILGISQLDKFGMMLKLIEKNHKKKIILEEIPLDCKKTLKLFSKGLTEEVFQFSSGGLKKYSELVKPTDIDDIIAMNALYRPGAMESNAHIDYALIKHGKKKPEFDFKLREVTEKTHGLYIFQEQILKAVNVLGGLSLSEADKFRTAIKKMDKQIMLDYETRFIEGAAKRGCREQEAKKIWKKLLSFAGYGFNKCLSGDTLVFRFTGNQFGKKEITIEELYEASHDSSRKVYWKYKRQGHLGLVRYYNLYKEKIQYQKVKAVHQNGIREVFEIKLINGFKIKATSNHRLMLHDEMYKEVSELRIGDKMIICGDKFDDYNFQKNSLSGISRGWTKYYKGHLSDKGRPYIDFRSRDFKLAKDFAFKRSGGCCECCKKNEGRVEYHHVDGDHFNNKFENVMYVCNSCHKKLDYKIGRRHGKRDGGYLVDYSEIKSIKKVGKEMTYDLEMFDDPHNFIANGFVSHNSHSAAYGIMAYWCQWLKCHYPLEFFTVSFNFAKGDQIDIPNIVNEIKKMKLDFKILTPEINKSRKTFVGNKYDSAIYWSLTKIKGFAAATVDKIIEERKNKGKFTSLIDFVKRMDGSGLGKGRIQSLIVCGAFDKLESIKEPKDRLKLLKEFYGYRKEEVPELFLHKKYFKNHNWLLLQKDLIDYGYIDFKSVLKDVDSGFYNTYVDVEEFLESKPYKKVTVAGKIVTLTERNSKNGKFGQITLLSNDEFIFITVWNDVWILEKEKFEKAKHDKLLIAMSGKVKDDRGYRGHNVLHSDAIETKVKLL